MKYWIYTARGNQRRRRRIQWRSPYPLALLVFFLALSACNSSNQLHDYHFDDATVAVVANIPPRPAIFTDFLNESRVDPNDPIGSVFRAGTAIAKQAEVRHAQTRMDSALYYVDMTDRIAGQALYQSAQYLGYHPVDNPRDADYLLDIHVADYGLIADSWDATVHFEVNAEMLLVDRRTRNVIWKTRLREAEPVSQTVGEGLGTTFGNVYTAITLSQLSVEEMSTALESLADFSASRMITALRHDYYTER